MADLGYLQIHENPNARVRADGRRYHGYPTRSKPVQVICVHTAETAPGTVSAEAVASYFTKSTRAASYHEVGDSNSYVTCLPPGATAFGAVGWNSNAWHWSFATRAHLWGDNPLWDSAALAIGATRCRIAADLFDIPTRHITRAQAEKGVKGFIGHGQLDPTRRTDPGSRFTWTRFLDMVQAEAEDDMALTDEDIQRIWDFRVDPEMNARSALKWAWRHSKSAKASLDALPAADTDAITAKVLAAQTTADARAVIAELADALDRGLN